MKDTFMFKTGELSNGQVQYGHVNTLISRNALRNILRIELTIISGHDWMHFGHKS